MLVNPTLLAGFLAMSALLSAIPGPSVLLETSRAITHGRGSAMWVMVGNFLGGLLLLALVLLGLGAVVIASAPLFLGIKIGGAAYLMWLGLNAILASRRPRTSPIASGDDRRRSPIASVRQGLTVGVSNPKSIVFLMAVLPQFVDPTLPNPVLQMAVVGAAGSLTQVLVETVWIAAAGSLRAWFLANQRRTSRLEAAGGVCMIGLSAKLALQP